MAVKRWLYRRIFLEIDSEARDESRESSTGRNRAAVGLRCTPTGAKIAAARRYSAPFRVASHPRSVGLAHSRTRGWSNPPSPPNSLAPHTVRRRLGTLLRARVARFRALPSPRAVADGRFPPRRPAIDQSSLYRFRVVMALSTRAVTLKASCAPNLRAVRRAGARRAAAITTRCDIARARPSRVARRRRRLRRSVRSRPRRRERKKEKPRRRLRASRRRPPR